MQKGIIQMAETNEIITQEQSELPTPTTVEKEAAYGENDTDNEQFQAESFEEETMDMESLVKTTNNEVIQQIAQGSDDELINGLDLQQSQMLRELLRKTQYSAYRLTRASKAEKKEMFRSEHIITEDGTVPVQTEATMLKQDMMELNASAQARRILEGKIIGVRSANKDNKVATNLAEVAYGNGTCNVLIPDFLLFNYQMDKYRDPGKQKEVEKIVQDMIGVQIKFIVKSFDQKTRTAYADRLKALESESRANYVRPTKDGKPRVTEGLIVQGRITRVAKKGIVVCALGAEATIKKEDLSWGFIPDCRSVYNINDPINLKVMKIEEKHVEKYSEKYTLISATFSAKETSADPMKLYYDYFQEGGKYQATVTYVPTEGSGVFVRLQDKVDCLVAFPKFGNLPYAGQQRVVEITTKEIDPDTGRKKIFGIFATM